MLKPPIRKITKVTLDVDFDFSKYNTFEEEKVEEIAPVVKIDDDEVYEP